MSGQCLCLRGRKRVIAQPEFIAVFGEGWPRDQPQHRRHEQRQAGTRLDHDIPPPSPSGRLWRSSRPPFGQALTNMASAYHGSAIKKRRLQALCRNDRPEGREKDHAQPSPAFDVRRHDRADRAPNGRCRPLACARISHSALQGRVAADRGPRRRSPPAHDAGGEGRADHRGVGRQEGDLRRAAPARSRQAARALSQRHGPGGAPVRREGRGVAARHAGPRRPPDHSARQRAPTLGGQRNAARHSDPVP